MKSPFWSTINLKSLFEWKNIVVYLSICVRGEREFVRINIKMPSNTAQPIAELKILRDMRKEVPSKKPEIPR